MTDPRAESLHTFVQWAQAHVRGDEKGEAQIFLDRLFVAFGHAGSLDVGGEPEFRIRKAAQDGGGTSFADYVWKPVVLIDMKRRGERLSRHYRQAFDYWTRLVPGRPRYVTCSAVTKRPVFCFISTSIRPDHALYTFAFADDYSFGILQSHTHWLWFITKCGKLTEKFRYTPESVFDTFPWPQEPAAKEIAKVAAAGRRPRRLGRSGARRLQLQRPAGPARATTQVEPDRRRPPRTRRTRDRPGLPPSVKNPATFVTADCIRPRAE